MTEQRLTRRQAAILGCFTGISLESRGISAIQELAEELLGRPVWTHEFASEKFTADLKERARPLLADIAYVADEAPDA